MKIIEESASGLSATQPNYYMYITLYLVFFLSIIYSYSDYVIDDGTQWAVNRGEAGSANGGETEAVDVGNTATKARRVTKRRTEWQTGK